MVGVVVGGGEVLVRVEVNVNMDVMIYGMFWWVCIYKFIFIFGILYGDCFII